MKFARTWRAVAVAALGLASIGLAQATPYVVFDFKTGAVLKQHEATHKWFPASTTKLLTVYVALEAVREGRFTFDSPFVVTRRAAVMPPSKMGFQPGTIITLGNALKMLMVKSANDVAITVAEGIDGSVENFAAEMNRTAHKLGMNDSHFVTPNGLPDVDHYSSARDLALVAESLYRDFPEEAGLFDIGELSYGGHTIRNYNHLLGKFPGADGMKTGFTCAAGFNIVVSATRGDRHLGVVVLGQATSRERDIVAADLLQQAFTGHDQPSGTLQSLPDEGGPPSDMHPYACGKLRAKAVEGAEGDALGSDAPAASGNGVVRIAAKAASGAPQDYGVAVVSEPLPRFDPLPVYIGQAPGKNLAVTPVVANPLEITPFPAPPPRKVHHRRVVRKRVARRETHKGHKHHVTHAKKHAHKKSVAHHVVKKHKAVKRKVKHEHHG